MGWTQEDLDRLKQAIATGARSVQIGDERYEFRSTTELFGLLRRMEDELGLEGPSRRTFAEVRRGFTRGRGSQRWGVNIISS